MSSPQQKKARTTAPAAPKLNGPPEVSPLRELWAVAWPTVLTMTSYTVMQFVDSLMVSVVGPVEFTAQSNGGMVIFIPIAFITGMLTLVNTYVSQNLGAGTPENAPRYAWAAMWMAAMSWCLLLVFSLVLPALFDATRHDQQLKDLETGYGQILLWGSILTISSRALSHFFYGLHRPKVVFVATVVGNLINVGANWILIFGKLGAPALGVYGAAYGTLIGTAVELLIPLAVFLGPSMNRQLATRSAWRPNLKAMVQLARLGWPKGVTFANEMLCWTIFMVVLVGNYFDKAHMAAGWIALKYMHLSFMPAVGISVAVTAVVGKYVGAGRPDVAEQRAWLGVRLSVLYMGACAACFVIFREPMVDLFISLDVVADPQAALMRTEIMNAATKILICAAVFQVFDAVAITLSGALAGAGDTIWPGAANVIASWLCIIGIGWTLAVLFPDLGSLGPWIGAALFIISLSIALVWRWRSGYWRTINLLLHAPRDKGGDGPTAADNDDDHDAAQQLGSDTSEDADTENKLQPA